MYPQCSVTTLTLHIIQQYMVDVVVKAHMQFCLDCRESPHGPTQIKAVIVGILHGRGAVPLNGNGNVRLPRWLKFPPV
jgi:hypothetical protein